MNPEALQDSYPLYSCLDSAVTYKCSENIFKELEETGYADMYDNTIDLCDALTYMMLIGIRIDKGRLERTKADANSTIEELQTELNSLCGFEFNYNSTKQCQQYFYGIKGYKPYKQRKTGAVTTDEKALARMAAKGVREAQLITKLRKRRKLLSTYLEVSLDPDNRLRCSWRPRGTKFTRVSSAKTIFNTGLNLQNIHPEFRGFMVPDPGYVFLGWDKVQAEWIVTAYLSQDANMLRVINEKMDPHVGTGALMTGLPASMIIKENKLLEKVTDPEKLHKGREEHVPEILKAPFLPRTVTVRQMGKKSNHALNYDEGYMRFAAENELEFKEAKRFHDAYHNAYLGLRGSYYPGIQHELRKNRTLKNCFGHKITFRGRWDHALFKSAYSFKPQSTVGGIINEGLIKIFQDRTQVIEPMQLLSQVHDEILAQYPAKNWDLVAKAVLRVRDHINPVLMYNNREFQIDTEMKIGLNWADMRKVPIVDNVGEMADRLESAYKELPK